MRRIIKRDGLVVDLQFSHFADKKVSIKGDVYPFAQRFHSARLSVERGSTFGSDENEVRCECGFGGNTYDAESFDLMLKAGQLASDLGKYYTSRMKEMMVPSVAMGALECAFREKDFVTLYESVALLPLSNLPIYKIEQSMTRNFTPTAMTALDMIFAFPNFDDLLVRLEEAAGGDESAWESPEVSTLLVLFTGSGSWDTLKDRLGDNSDFSERARVMREAIFETSMDYFEHGMFTTLKKRYSIKK